MKKVLYLIVFIACSVSNISGAQNYDEVENVQPTFIMNKLSTVDQGLDTVVNDVVADDEKSEFSPEFLRSKGIYLLDRGALVKSELTEYSVSETVPILEAEQVYTNDFEFKKVEQLEEVLFKANLNIINKRTDNLTKIKLSSYEVVEFNGLFLTAKNCVSNYGGVKGNDILFITIADSMENILFNGWLYVQAPSASSFSHHVYSIKFQSCLTN